MPEVDHVPVVPAESLAERPPRVGFVSLGCPKALVDSERIDRKSVV